MSIQFKLRVFEGFANRIPQLLLLLARGKILLSSDDNKLVGQFVVLKSGVLKHHLSHMETCLLAAAQD